MRGTKTRERQEAPRAKLHFTFFDRGEDQLACFGDGQREESVSQTQKKVAYVQRTEAWEPGRYVRGKFVKWSDGLTAWEVRLVPPHAGETLVRVSAFVRGDKAETFLFPSDGKEGMDSVELDGSVTGYGDPERLLRALGYEIDHSESKGNDLCGWVRQDRK